MSKKKTVLSKEEVLKEIKAVAARVKHSVDKIKSPELSMPIRSLNNVSFDKDVGYFELLGKTKTRHLSANTIKTFAQTLLMLNESRKVIETNDFVNKREAYYNSKNWGEARFKEESEASSVLEDAEAMLGFNREQMGFFPGVRGGSVVGNLIIVDDGLDIDCTKQGSGSWSIPSTVEHLGFKTKAKFILVVETTALFDRLNKHKYWQKSNCICVATAGVPTRNTRRFVRRLADDMKLPVYVFTDGDPYGYANIYRTFKVGSGNAAHINKFFCVPQAQFLGVTPDDIIQFKLPTHPLKDVDVKRAKDALKNDPFILANKEWQKAIQKMIKMKVRAEQQAFAAHGLNYVHQVYLPEKLKNKKTWLP
ncbi:DNA topoisomerase IV subunit A [Candidatus Woesearchaeota archaeon]|jgi:DNA topoisomerase VI subunit A|nr:DNA topoisomerase IV subunit A [Candidatus Woesearchaeota archaeon]